MIIRSMELYQIYDSLGMPTFEAKINDSAAACPNGISKGKYEVKVTSQTNVIKSFSKIKQKLMAAKSQEEFDGILKINIQKLGAQATTALSLAFYSATKTKSMTNFPNLLGNVIGGGLHSLDSKMSIQEILVMPKAQTLPQAIERNFTVWHEVGEALRKKYHTALGFEAAWSAPVGDEEALDIAYSIARRNRCTLGIDMASSNFHERGKYYFAGKLRSREKHIDYILDLIKDFKLFYVEDPLKEDDFSGFAEIQKNSKAIVCADDLVATHSDRLRTAIRYGSCKAVIIKPNQVGTVSDCLHSIKIAKKYGIIPVISHRSGETPDTSICKLAQEVPIAKFGIAGIRIIKLNSLLRLWNSARNPKISELKL